VRKLQILDTTLRDGEQAPCNEMSADCKRHLFSLIDSTGVDYIEVGFPAASPLEFELAQEFAHVPRRARLTVFARAVEKDIERALEAVRGTDDYQLQLLLTGSEVHVEHKRRSTIEAIFAETRRVCDFARRAGVRDLALGYEDASRGSREFLRRVVEIGVENGGTLVVLADTVGAALPSDMVALVTDVRKWIGEAAELSVHCHNDLGLALANGLAAALAGASMVQGTMGGIGERTGNTPIEELAAIAHYKAKDFGFRTSVDLVRVTEVALAVLRELGHEPWPHKPIIGRYAFSTAAGIHASGVMHAPITYEYVRPEDFGQTREIVLNRASGRANLRHVLDGQGLPYDEPLLKRIYEIFVADPQPSRFNDDDNFRQLYEAALEVVRVS
jgi:2-isopropylmalate synthase